MEENVEQPKAKKTKAIVFIVLAIVAIVGAGAGAYFYRDKVANDAAMSTSAQVKELQATVAELKKQVETSKTPSGGTACAAVQPNATTIENIEASITSGNTAALEGYMASSVTVIYAASEGVGPRTPAQAVGDVTSFIGDITAVTWTFDVPASLLSSYGAGGYGKYFPSTAVVGKSSDKKVLSFNFDCNGKISTVFFAMNEMSLE